MSFFVEILNGESTDSDDASSEDIVNGEDYDCDGNNNTEDIVNGGYKDSDTSNSEYCEC